MLAGHFMRGGEVIDGGEVMTELEAAQARAGRKAPQGTLKNSVLVICSMGVNAILSLPYHVISLGC